MSFTLWVKIKRFWMRHGVSSWRHCQCRWRGGGWGNLRASLLSRLVTCKRPREFPWGFLWLTSVLNGRRRLSKWLSRRAAAFTRMRTVLNCLVPKLSDWAEEAWNQAQILPTSLTGVVTSDIAVEDDLEQGWFSHSFQLVTGFYWKGGRSKSVSHFKQIKDMRKCFLKLQEPSPLFFLRGAVWKLKILKRVTKTVNNY